MVFTEAAILPQATRIRNDIENHFVPITKIFGEVRSSGKLKYDAWSQLLKYVLEFKKIFETFLRHSKFLQTNFSHFEEISDDCKIIEAKIIVLKYFHFQVEEDLVIIGSYDRSIENAPDGKVILEICRNTVDTLRETEKLIDDMWDSVSKKTENGGLNLDLTHIPR